MADRATPQGPDGEVTCVSGQTFCLSGGNGQMRPGVDHGFYVRDTRLLSVLLLRIDGEEPHALGGYPLGPGTARFSGCVTRGDDADPTLLIERRRLVTDVLRETIRVTNHAPVAVEMLVQIEAATDFAYIFDVKHGRILPVSPGSADVDGLRFSAGSGVGNAKLRAVPAPDELVPGLLSWTVTLATQTDWELELLVGSEDADITEQHEASTASAPMTTPVGVLSAPRVACSDERFTRLIEQSVVDLTSLLVRDGEHYYVAAGTPWYLTLFGRDSLWSALMSLPLGTEIAEQTLRALASRQGTGYDPVTEEAPGRIIHEVRYGMLVERGDLPPLYYGTIDATPLFVILLERAWRWGLDPAVVASLLPNAERALAWMHDDGDPDDDGFLEYAALGPRRLANQGWKDSGDAISFADGTLADPPIALCEVQGYAYQAAIAGAALLDAFGRPGADDWRAWATTLRARFRERFWVNGAVPSYPALALGGDDRQVDGVTSNMAHLLGTGILDPTESALIAARLAGPDLDCGWGLRTLSSTSPRFNPLSYHGGSVWPHDTAIAIDGLAQIDAGSTASHLLHGLVAASQHFGYRLPELFGGEQRTARSQPLPYPSACRPQAWAAGAALLLLRAVLGIEPDLPNGVLTIRPMRPAPFSRLAVDGMPLGNGRLTVTLEDGEVSVLEAPQGIEVIVATASEHTDG